MKSVFSWASEVLDKPLCTRSRMLLILAAFLLLPTFYFPLWNLEFWSYQYPDGLTLDIYSHKLQGGNEGADLAEINILNHYIGMAALEEEDFLELKWIPLAIGVFFILTLRAVIYGKINKTVDVVVLFTYFGLFSLWSFGSRLHYYGHTLDPKAAVTVDPFTPPLFGYELVGQFKVWSYPSTSSYLFFGFVFLLALAILLSAREDKTATK
jgi:hypothetical protein